MGLKDFFKKQLRSVVEWENQLPGVLFYKYPSSSDEIKNRSKLIVAPGQGCILVYEGVINDVLIEEGTFDLSTANHPFITSLLKVMQLFESEHKMRLYFFRRAECVNQQWGTSTPVKYLDPVYKFPIELGLNGSYSFKVTDARRFFSEIVASRDQYNTSEARELLQSRIPQTLASHLAAAGLSYQHIDASLDSLSAQLRDKLNQTFADIGFELTDFRINGTLFDKDTQARIRRIADVTADARAAAEGGLDYVDMEKLQALRDAARNEGGLAGAGLQFGAGMELGKTMLDKKDTNVDPVQQLQKLKLLLNEGIITQEEFDAKKKEWLSKM